MPTFTAETSFLNKKVQRNNAEVQTEQIVLNGHWENQHSKVP